MKLFFNHVKMSTDELRCMRKNGIFIDEVCTTCPTGEYATSEGTCVECPDTDSEDIHICGKFPLYCQGKPSTTTKECLQLESGKWKEDETRSSKLFVTIVLSILGVFFLGLIMYAVYYNYNKERNRLIDKLAGPGGRLS
jgi:hypothetical protein